MTSQSQQIEDVNQYMLQLGKQARAAARLMSAANTGQKNKALVAIANAIDNARQNLAEANKNDMRRGKESGLEAALLDRLELTPARIDGMIEGLHQVAALPDPVGAISDVSERPSGIQVGRMRVPLGVIGIIYESRPNVTAEAASLCLKSGNACILRGGSEALASNQAVASCIVDGLATAGLPAHGVQVVATSDRAAVGQLITMPDYVDVIVPRGGKGLIERISKEAQVTVIKHLDGICHVYVDDDADLDMAFDIAINAKTQRYGTCNTMETLLIAKEVAAKLLPRLQEAYQSHNVELRGCELTQALIDVKKADKADWSTEYLAPILSIKIVADIDDAMDHIERYSSRHTDTIVTNNHQHAMRFLREVDSSSVMINASTRFADGFEYGLGAEIGISTDKIHARGPVGLEGLTSQKFIVLGSGQIRR